MSKPPIRIGNAQAFWGDRGDAAAELLAQVPDLDYLTLDYLAEVSLSILAGQRAKDPAAGYPRDFLEVVRSLAPYWAGGGKCKLVANAGGLDPAACARAVAETLAKAGCPSLKIAAVAGDDVLPLLAAAAGDAFTNLDTGAKLDSVRERLVTANAYIGASPVAEALNAGAQIVVTGRVADPSMVVGVCLHHFGWNEDDWNRLAGATVAGHLIECGTQATGGIATDWLELPDPAHLSFPIVEVDSDGGCIVAKAPGTGGEVSRRTVCEQLVYEIGDPGRYLSPDVEVSFLGLTVEELGADRVRVTGAIGRPRPHTLKVSATYRDGFRAAGTLVIVGRNAAAKARRCGEIVLGRLLEAGVVLRDAVVETLGAGMCVPTANPNLDPESALETVLRIAVEAEAKAPCERFAKELMPLITAGPQGTTGYAEGRPKVHEITRYWPCLVDRSRVTPTVEHFTSAAPSAAAAQFAARPQRPFAPAPVPPRANHGTLGDLAWARSGDKGSGANIGILARRPEDYLRLAAFLTADRVAAYFAPAGVETVTRYEAPNLGGLNFVLKGILKRSLRTDAQGKALGQALLEMQLE
ncbi:MAG TPA: acyclic terpene utilization AtuA family protein [Planctomycetia bacterium]|nr:acyclic terpene utilization AtuA family protein [Planctomycetia bacterium]